MTDLRDRLRTFARAGSAPINDACAQALDEIARLQADARRPKPLSVTRVLTEPEKEARLACTLVQRLRQRAAYAREEKTGTADGDAYHFEEAAAAIEQLQTATSEGGTAAIERGSIVIRVAIDALQSVITGKWSTNNEPVLYKITNKDEFAADLVRALNDEDEQGSTRIHKMFDAAIEHAIDQGAFGIEEHKCACMQPGGDPLGNCEVCEPAGTALTAGMDAKATGG